MRAICIDDEELIMNMTVSMCQELYQIDEAVGFTEVIEALKWLEKHPVDIAFMDIDMPDMNGIALAALVKQKYPSASIIFITGYSQYALDAFKLHASGYLMKPITKARLEEEVEYALSRKKTTSHSSAHIAVRTFGEFDVYVDGRLVTFRRAKAKELLAYLVDRQGGNVTRAEVFSVLWEGGEYDRTMQKQVDVIVRSLRDTLKEYGINDIVRIDRNGMNIRAEIIDCDLYRFLDGDAEVINKYRGEYMNSYHWANLTEGYITSALSDRY